MRIIEFETKKRDHGSAITIARGCCDQISTMYCDESEITPLDVLSVFQQAIPFALTEGKPIADNVKPCFDLYGVCFQRKAAIVRYRGDHISYLLVGFDAVSNTPYFHGVSAQAVRYACRTEPASLDAPVQIGQRSIWKLSQKRWSQGVGHGEFYFVPEEAPRGELISPSSFAVSEETRVTYDQIWLDRYDRMYVRNPVVQLPDEDEPFRYAGDRYFSMTSSSDVTIDW